MYDPSTNLIWLNMLNNRKVKQKMVSQKEYPIDNDKLEHHLNIFLKEWATKIEENGLEDASLDEKDRVRPTRSRSYGEIGKIFMKLVDVVLSNDKFRNFPSDTKEVMRDEALFDVLRGIRRWERDRTATSYFYTIAKTACTRTLTRYHYKKRLDCIEYNDEILVDEVIQNHD